MGMAATGAISTDHKYVLSSLSIFLASFIPSLPTLIRTLPRCRLFGMINSVCILSMQYEIQSKKKETQFAGGGLLLVKEVKGARIFKPFKEPRNGFQQKG